MVPPKDNYNPKPSSDIMHEIKQLLQHQRFAVKRAASIGMSRDEAAEMEARITQIEELLDRLREVE